MPKKITDQVMISVDDLIKVDGENGIEVYVVRGIEKSAALGNRINYVDYAARSNACYQVDLMNLGAEVISGLELIRLFMDTQEELRKHEAEAIERARKEDSSGGKFS